MMKFREPTLAYNKAFRLQDLRYPLAASGKYDGIRCVRHSRLGLVSRRLKKIPNVAVRRWLESMPALVWADGELVVGDPFAHDCYNRTSSKIMTRDADRDDVRLFLIDRYHPTMGFRARRAELAMMRLPKGVELIGQTIVHGARQALELRDRLVAQGLEGMMLRELDAPYKCGRSGLKEQVLLKVKLFEDYEATIVSVFPRRKNENALERDERGYAKRRKLQENMRDLPMVGGFVVRSRKRGTHRCGTGVLTHEQLLLLWRMRARLPGKVINCRVQMEGAKDAPRFPRCYGFRSKIDF